MNNFASRVLLFLAFCLSAGALVVAVASRDVAAPPPVENHTDDIEEALTAEIRQLRDDINVLRSDVAELSRTPALASAVPTQISSPLPVAEISTEQNAGLQAQLIGLRNTVEEIRTELVRGGSLRPGSNEVFYAKNSIMDQQATIKDKLAALRTLRRADALSDDVAKQMAQAYYTTADNPNAQADIFRQLDGMTTPELKAPLLDAVSKATNTRVREEAADTLANYLPDPDVVAWLTHLAANDPSGSVRREATRSLRRLKNQ